MCTVKIVLFFFFQAEDGIRDKLVTGVQTCALPIWSSLSIVCPPFSSFSHHDHCIFAWVNVIAFAEALLDKPELPVERQGGRVRRPHLEQRRPYALRRRSRQRVTDQRQANAVAPDLRTDGQVHEVQLLKDHPEHDIPQERPRRHALSESGAACPQHQIRRERIALQLAKKHLAGPGLAERPLLQVQNLLEVALLHRGELVWSLQHHDVRRATGNLMSPLSQLTSASVRRR